MQCGFAAGLWSNTAAITSIALTTSTVNTLFNTQPPPYTASKTPKKGKQ
jgi:hypothetical protein